MGDTGPREDTGNAFLPNPNILLDGKKLSLQDFIKILEVEFDSGITYVRHVQQVAKAGA